MTQLEVRRDTQFITIAAMAYFMSRKRKLERKVLFYRNVLRTATLKHLWTLLSLTLFFKAIVSKLYLPNKITQLQKWTFGLRSRCSSLAFSLFFVASYLSNPYGVWLGQFWAPCFTSQNSVCSFYFQAFSGKKWDNFICLMWIQDEIRRRWLYVEIDHRPVFTSRWIIRLRRL